jgi:hypothetical protein
LYELVVLGAPSDAQIAELKAVVSAAVGGFGLTLGREVAWLVKPDTFSPEQQRSTAAIFIGAEGAPTDHVDLLLRAGIPILPVFTGPSGVSRDIPPALRHLNCLAYTAGGAQRVATALLECVGLLPRQRRIFLSYRRDEARQAALQLFDALSSRLFDVFLDTHGIAPGEDFQAMLWHRLCDSDVLVMLDTPGYFDSRWTGAEFGRALSKGIAVLQVGWPDSTPSIRTQTASRSELLAEEVSADTGLLAQNAVLRICLQVEAVRSQSHAVRMVNLVGNIRNAVERIQGQVVGVGPHKAVHIQLVDGKAVVVYPTLGVPTSRSLHDAADWSPGETVAVVYDHVGMHPQWLQHIDWLGSHVRSARWLKAHEVAWQLADWGA